MTFSRNRTQRWDIWDCPSPRSSLCSSPSGRASPRRNFLVRAIRPTQQAGKVAHSLERVLRARLDEALSWGQRAIAEHGHSRGNAGRNAGWRVFNDGAGRGYDTLLVRRIQEHVGEGLAARNLRNAVHFSSKLRQQAGNPQRRPHLLVRTARGNAERYAHRGQHRLDIRDRPQFRLQCRGGAAVELLDELVRNRPSLNLCHDRQALRQGASDKLFEHILERHRNPQFIEHFGEYSIGDQFTVHQHAVAIENHQTEFLVAHLTAASCTNTSAMNAKNFNTPALAGPVLAAMRGTERA